MFLFKELTVYKKAFSLAEIITVMVVLGVLTSVALPRYFVTVEKMRSQEGVHTLTVVNSAVSRYKMDHSEQCPPARGADMNTFLAAVDLDIDLPPSKYYWQPEVVCSAVWDDIAILRTRNITYYLKIKKNGDICCGNSSLCPKMGYPVCP